MFGSIQKYLALRRINKLTRDKFEGEWNKLRSLDLNGEFFNYDQFSLAKKAVYPFMELYHTLGEAFMYRFIEDVADSKFKEDFVDALIKYIDTPAFLNLQDAMKTGYFTKANLLATDLAAFLGLYLSEVDHLWYSRIRFAIRIRSLRFDKGVPEKSPWEASL